jgi:IS30 family transposase
MLERQPGSVYRVANRTSGIARLPHDLLTGSVNTYIATLAEQHSRYAMLVKVARKDTASVVSALINQVNRLPAKLLRS